ncbi:Fe-S biogenesis protein NfuA [Blochmannia endosymbiont of Colobopsis nipponica]|uniref:Fe-S biogenesis protein NfuA n=1 Tax=Blochmannia endosymbiont of Colobopsis nipponica TaxID=2681987 RepID=UPI00177E212B|nr:Fe-S biogenesis protein NfuA [Blochmannia endosymbiont of Colobopsis nipponica]QOI10901.1 Fe-S biogenesis protein NfuA [Blochmannia endosymbiont of Colobopsis nipponica]
MIDITNIAQEHLTKLLSQQKPGTQIRIFVIEPGTYNAECGISYCFAENINPSDIKIRFKSFSVYINKTNLPYLKDTEIDLIFNQTESQLTIKAPNARMCQPNDDAPLDKKIEYILQSKINPVLAQHGGSVKLIEITKDMSAIIQFSGGCNGCSMVNLTLKESIEKELLQKFPELKKICDLTEHQHGKHSFY